MVLYYCEEQKMAINTQQGSHYEFAIVDEGRGVKTFMNSCDIKK
jgi:hypothetical protein